MISKESLHLGQHVWFGAEKREGVVDGISQTVVGLMMVGGGYVLAEWDELALCG